MTPPPDAASAGGTAFPFSTTRDTMTSGNWASSPGMTLRDYFAAAVIQGLCANPGGPFQECPASGWRIVNCDEADIAATAYRTADAMLATRALLATPGEGEGA